MKNSIIKIIKKILIALIICLTIVGFFSILDEKPTFADSGFSTSHSSSSGSSSSHSSSSHSSSSSHRSSSSSSSTSRRSSSSNGGSSSLAGVVMAFTYIVMVIVLIILIKTRGKSRHSGMIDENYDDSKVESTIKGILPTFDKKKFIEESFDIYKDVQKAWMNFDLNSVQDKITDELYSMYQSQLDTLEVKGEQNIMKDITLHKAFLKAISNQNEVVTITACYIIDQYDYIADASTGKLIRGENKKKMRVKYEMKFRMNMGANAKVDTCPNCGAKLTNYNGSGNCEYCGAKIVSDSASWVLTEKQALDQRYI